jgi:uncharacterized surface protein with fasciclin (FAS1) repeats
MTTRFWATTLVVAVLGVNGCADAGTDLAGPYEPELAATSRGGVVAEAAVPGRDPIAAIAIDAGFSELVGALQYVDAELGAGLVDLFLNGREQYTVFAPTNDAFENLYGLLSVVLGASITEITDVPAAVVLDVLRYHVVEGRRAAVSVVPQRGERRLVALLGESFFVRPDLTVRDGLSGLRSDAAIVSPNISASNGIIHVIDEVLVPPSVVAVLTN